MRLKYNLNDHLYIDLCTSCVTFRTDGRPLCCPYYFPKSNSCEGMSYLCRRFEAKVFFLSHARVMLCSSLEKQRDCCLIYRKRCGATLRLQHDGHLTKDWEHKTRSC